MDNYADSSGNAPAADPVRGVLDGVRRMMRGQRGRTDHASRRRAAGRGGAPDKRDGWTGAHPDEHDPQPLGAVLAGYTADRGWERPLAESRVFADWTRLVGADVAAHCAPTGLRDGELRVAAESTAWATQLRLLGATMLARIVDELGPDIVTRIVVSGPVGPSWKHGRLSVPGSRGPRDTYG